MPAAEIRECGRTGTRAMISIRAFCSYTAARFIRAQRRSTSWDVCRVECFGAIDSIVYFFKPNGLDPAVPDLEAGTSDGTVVARQEFDDPALS